MGGSERDEHLKHNVGASKHKRPSFFRKLGDRILRAFHRKSRGRITRIDDRYSHSTGDLINDVHDSRTNTAEEFISPGTRCELPGPSLSAEDRAVSEGHIQDVCASRTQSSELLRPKATFLSSDFQNELNSKLRLLPRDPTSRSAGMGVKTTGSSGSLASDDSAFFNQVGGSDERLSPRDTPNTPDSGVAVKSSYILASPSLVGTQHKLAVSKQRNRRPPTLFGASTPLQESQNRSLLDSSCAGFFNSSGSSLSGAHVTRLDFITEEENELQSSTPQTPMSVPQTCRSSLNVHPCTASGETADELPVASKSATAAGTTQFLVKESDIVGSISFSDSTTGVEPKCSFFSQNSCDTTTSTPQSAFTHRVSVNLHSTHKRTLSDDEDDRVPSHPQASPIPRPTPRPFSMYATVLPDTPKEHTRGVSPLPPRKRLQTTECYVKAGAPTNEPHNHDANTVTKLTNDSKNGDHEDEPELKSVADRASVFGAVLHSLKPAPPPPLSPTQVRRRNMEQSEATANNRTSRVFSLVKNFEQSC